MEDFCELKINTSMDHIYDLHTQFIVNVIEIDKIIENINKIETSTSIDPDELELLYHNEFFLYMKHIDIYDDLILNINREPKTDLNVFELKKLQRDADKMLRVDIINI